MEDGSSKLGNPTVDAGKIESISMNSSTTDKVKGTAREVAGKVKEETGKAIGNPDLQDRGTGEKVAGKVERKIGDVKKVFGK
jgi:uncharacterized protein YjbJ (UPF0337 family)